MQNIQIESNIKQKLPKGIQMRFNQRSESQWSQRDGQIMAWGFAISGGTKLNPGTGAEVRARSCTPPPINSHLLLFNITIILLYLVRSQAARRSNVRFRNIWNINTIAWEVCRCRIDSPILEIPFFSRWDLAEVNLPDFQTRRLSNFLQRPHLQVKLPVQVAP